ncbi:MAG: hypothetical protein V1679_01005 [Candidatus Peregrinibacteria bacterium]
MDLESFISAEGGEGMSEAAFEAFKEKMKKAAAQIAQIQKEEKKAKKKEEELLKILLKFIKNSSKKDLVLLISRVLEQNIPANYILAVILLGNEDIQEEIGKYLMLKSAEISDEKSLAFFGEDESLPLKVKIELDNWIKSMMVQADDNPHKLLKTAYEYDEDNKKTVCRPLVILTAFIIRDYLEQKKLDESYDKLKNFAEFITEGILNKTQENLDERKSLE